MDTINCTKCGAPSRTGTKFCSKCGAPFSVQRNVQPVRPAQQQYGAQRMQPAYYSAPAAAQYSNAQAQARPVMPKRTKATIIAIAAMVAAAFCVLVGVLLSGGVASGTTADDYYSIGADRVPSVTFALGEKRKIQDTKTDVGNGIETLSVMYKVSGSNQGADMRAYVDYLQRKDGFYPCSDTNRSAFDPASGSGIQVWRNAGRQGYMLVVQVDYDRSGYTITLMRGEGQVPEPQSSGGGSSSPQPPVSPPTETPQPPVSPPDDFPQPPVSPPTGSPQPPVSPPTETPQPPAPPPDDPLPGGQSEFASLLPPGEPDSVNTLNGFEIASYYDGTISINGGRGIIKPDGSIYFNGEYSEYVDTTFIPDTGTVMNVNNCTMVLFDGFLYVAANGGMIIVDSDGVAYAFATY